MKIDSPATCASFVMGTLRPVVDFLVEFLRRALLDQALVPVKYELIVVAGRDPGLAAQMNAYEHIQSSMLGETLERLTRPTAAAAELPRRRDRTT